MNCEKYTELIEKYLSVEIKDTELEQLKDHIGQCKPSPMLRYDQSSDSHLGVFFPIFSCPASLD